MGTLARLKAGGRSQRVHGLSIAWAIVGGSDGGSGREVQVANALSGGARRNTSQDGRGGVDNGDGLGAALGVSCGKVS